MPTRSITEVILAALDVGIVACTSDLDRILYVNAAGLVLLARFGDVSDELPPTLAVVAKSLDAAADPARFSSAAKVHSPASTDPIFVRTRRLSHDDGVLVTLSAGVRRRTDYDRLLGPPHRLSRREVELIGLVCEGLANKQIAERMKVSLGTVKKYLSRVLAAFDVESRAQLIAAVDHLLQAS
jgi:DNA-binding CsgD family transcriptional regulator